MMTLLAILYLLLKAVLYVTALIVLLSFTVAWYERANANPELMQRRFTWQGIGLAGWLMLQETACLLTTIALRPFGWGEARVQGDLRSPQLPIILIHGLFQNRSCLYLLVHRLRRAGYEQVYPINTPPWRDLEALTETLAKKVDEIRLQFRVERIDLIGHSMGGIIGRNYIQKRGGADRVRHLVTLGSPHYGSKLAPFALSPMGLSLLPGSPFLRALNSSPPTGPRITAIYTRHENMVLPAGNARLEGASNIELAGMGHTALLFHPATWQATLAALKETENENLDRGEQPDRRADRHHREGG